MIGEETLAAWLPVLGSLVCKSLLVFAAAGAALWGLRRASAALRHLVCLLTLAALLALPVLSLALPGWRLPVLSMPVAPTPTAAQSIGVPIPAHKFATLPSEGRDKDKKASSEDLTETLPFEGRDRPGTNVNGPGIGTPRPFPWIILLPALWLLGLVLASLRPLLGLWGIASLSCASTPATDTAVLALAEECASALHLIATPNLRQAEAPVPMTWGGRHPVVLLPLDGQTWPEDRLRAVLLHEMAHVRRRDWLFHRFADLVCALYWFHPFIWLTARCLRAESEIACDDLVLTSGVAAPDYARHLLEVARALRPATSIPSAAIAMARTTHIEGRLKMILDPVRSRQSLTRRALLFVLTPGIAAVVMLAMLRPAAKAQTVPVPIAAPAQPPVAVPVIPAPVTPSAPRPVVASPMVAAPAASLPVPAPVADAPAVPSAKTAPSSGSIGLPKGHYGVSLRRVRPTGPVHVLAKGVTINLPPSGKSDPLVLTASQVAMVTATDPTKPPTLVVAGDLKINGTPLLAGVTDADTPGSPWWSGGGMLLPTPVYDTAAHPGEGHTFGRDTKNVIFAVRLPASAQDMTMEYQIPKSRGYSSDGFWPTKMQANAQQTEAQMFAKTAGVRVLTAAFPPSLKKADVRIGVASGAWKTVAAINATTNPSGLLREEGDVKVLLSPLTETIDLSTAPSSPQTVLTVATDTIDDLRVVAVDTQGREVFPLGIGGNSIGTLDQITARFALPLAQIKEVRVQTRKFQWIELKDIALQPAP